MPLIVDVVREQPRKLARSNVSLGPRFEACWLEEEVCDDIVSQAWESAQNVLEPAAGALRSVLADLKEWSSNSLGD
jgi:hypothetical protein